MAKETKEVVELLLSLGEAAGLALEDLDIGLRDALRIFDALRAAAPAIEGAEKIPAELAAWSTADSAELKAVAVKFDIPQDNIEAVVEAALTVAGPIIEFFAKFRKLSA